jgi:hypothetical protein
MGTKTKKAPEKAQAAPKVTKKKAKGAIEEPPAVEAEPRRAPRGEAVTAVETEQVARDVTGLATAGEDEAVVGQSGGLGLAGMIIFWSPRYILSRSKFRISFLHINKRMFLYFTRYKLPDLMRKSLRKMEIALAGNANS